jgi:hypothetical protein
MFPYEDACPCLVRRDIRIDALLSEDGYAHHESCAALKNAAVKGCRLCFMIMRSLFGTSYFRGRMMMSSC